MAISIATIAGCGSDGPDPQPAGETSTPEVAATSDAGLTSGVVDFSEVGVLVAATSFLDASDHGPAAELVQPTTAGRALVTATGVYAFLETPENQAQLRDVEPGTTIRLTGKLMREGRLLHADSVEVFEGIDLNLNPPRETGAESVTLRGSNKCMCGISEAEMHTSCALGHLHHLVADDGRIYHYLQTDAGQEAFATMNYHFKPVTVVGRVLPGQFLVVESIEVTSD